MRKLIRTILRILDGSPSMTMATRQRQRGQSMLEMAFITPLLIILIVGAVEVGWYTNHWLTLLEVTRVGARSGTFLQGEFDPNVWDNNASIHPKIQSELMGNSTPSGASFNARDCNSGFSGFYTFIVCTVLTSMDPLTLNIDKNDPLDADSPAQEADEAKPGYPGGDPLLYDDIVVSVFSVQVIDNEEYGGVEVNEDADGNRPIYYNFETPKKKIDPASPMYRYTIDLNGGHPDYIASDRDYPKGIQAIVVGRYPANANECTNVDKTTKLNPGDPGWEGDPFDYIPDNTVDSFYNSDGLQFNIELTAPDGTGLGDSGDEFQRGFAFSGQHRISDPNVYCWGSEFSMHDVEVLMNMPEFFQPDIYNIPTDPTARDAYMIELANSQEERRFLKSQGMTLVEIFWKHDLMLRFPFFRPILDAFGDNDRIVIALWSAFPLPSAQPNIIYQFP